MNDVDTILSSAEDIALHPEVAVSRAKVRLTDEHLLDIIFLGRHDQDVLRCLFNGSEAMIL